MLDLKNELSSINNNDTTFIDETKRDANEIKVGKCYLINFSKVDAFIDSISE